MAESIVLNLNAPPPVRESMAGWQAESFALGPVARDASSHRQRLDLAPDDVLEIELENGASLLVAAEDAERYLGRAVSRDAAQGQATLEVGQALRLSGASLPPGIAREGAGTWILKGLRIFRTGPAGMTALSAAGTFQDAQLGNRLGLYRLATDGWGMLSVPKMQRSPEPVLLFLHGTASSTAGSFKALWDEGVLGAREQMARMYGDRVYGFEHRSLTDSPVANVLALVETLPEEARLHVVSHSRGGMLGELLARSSRLGAEPFTETDVQRFLQHAQGTGRPGHAADADRLRALNKAMTARRIRVERFVRVAATARGTTLASGRLDRWASVMLNLLGKGLMAVPGLQPAGAAYTLLKNFLLQVVKERTDARVLPGLEAMMPDSPLVALLNAPDVELDSPLHVIAGDFDGGGLLAWLGDCLSESFYGGATDLVVNTPSMSGGAARRPGIWLKSVAGPSVHHLNYFRREESARPLLEALQGSDASFTRLDGPSRAFIARGGIHTKPLPDGPIALLLPGIMGSHLSIGRRIWMNPLEVLAGGMARLAVDAAAVAPDGWMDVSYERFAQHLAQSHEVRPFTYDWRLSITQAADKFGQVLDDAMVEARRRNKPVRIVAHSMGGLVARLALAQAGRWARLKMIPGSRLVQFGTPNAGSHSIAAVLTGRDPFVKMIERLDWKHDMKEFLQIVRAFPGVLELLPWPGKDGKAGDGNDYFDAALWTAWAGADGENQGPAMRGPNAAWQPAKGAGDGWLAPLATDLAAARAAVQAIAAAALEPDHTVYVAGSEKTPVAMRFVGGQMEIGWTLRGDGRVPWATGIPAGVKVWYVDAAHGDLLNHAPAFGEYVRLIDTGDCALDTTRGGARAAEDVVFTPAPMAPLTLYPSEEEIVAAAVGGRPPALLRRRQEAPGFQVTVQIFHGSVGAAQAPVLLGNYIGESLRTSAKYLNARLGGTLAWAQAVGRYPASLGEAAVFLQPDPAGTPGGAIAVGLGAVGQLDPGELTRALTCGLLEYARVHASARAKDEAPQRIPVSALLVGTGFGGLSVEVGARCMLEALARANRLLDSGGVPARIDSLSLFEEEETRAIAAALAIARLAQDRKFAATVRYDGRIHTGPGGFRAAPVDQAGSRGWHRVHINDLPEGGLRFTLVTDFARNDVDDEPDQRQAVEGLVRSATTSTLDQPGLSRALFELMVPNGFKQALPDLGGLIIAVDHKAAAYPWELMRDVAAGADEPLATRVCLVRQLASQRGRMRVPTVSDDCVLVVGDTLSGLAALPAAVHEGREVAQILREAGYRQRFLERPQAQTVLVNLFDEQYRIIHLAAHGVTRDGARQPGMVLGPDTYLTAAQIGKLRHVPELVFINCCHLGSMKDDAERHWAELAANLATAFIEMGCKAVVAAGWAVDDAAAATFAKVFYRAMLGGVPFGAAVRAARQETYHRHPTSNTWGAYQAYGDELYQLTSGEDEWQPPEYLHPSQVVAELDRLEARADAAAGDERELYLRRLVKVEEAARARFFHGAPVREALAQAWQALGDKARAIEHYRAALEAAEGSASLRAVEQLASLEIRWGAEKLRADAHSDGHTLMRTGFHRIQRLLKVGATVERQCILGLYWKLRAMCTAAAGVKEADVERSVKQMLQAYLKATDLSASPDGTPDYDALVNVLDGGLVLASRGDSTSLDQSRQRHLALLAQPPAGASAVGDGDEMWRRVHAQVAAARVQGLLATFDGRAEQSLENDAVRTIVTTNARHAARQAARLHTDESLEEQLQWLVAVLPREGQHRAVRTAVEKLLLDIGPARA